MNYNKDNKVNDDVNIGIGCLPYFIFFLILVGIRFILAKGKTWESGFVEFVELIYWVGIGYMVFVVLINKANEPRKLRKDEVLSLSIENHKKNIEKFIDINGKFKETYTVDNSEYLSHQLVELFNDQKELSYFKSRGISFNSYSYSKNILNFLLSSMNPGRILSIYLSYILLFWKRYWVRLNKYSCP